VPHFVLPEQGRSRAGSARIAVEVVAVAMVASTVVLGLTSDHLERPTATALYLGCLVAAPLSVGLYWWSRRPDSRFGRVLIAFGGVAWIWSWRSSDAPLLFDLGVASAAPALWFAFFLLLAFPTGRLGGVPARVLMAALAVTLVGLFVPLLLLSAVIAGGGPLSVCDPECPANVLRAASAPELVTWVDGVGTAAVLALTVGALALYAWRVRIAPRPQRRALLVVATTSLLFLPAFFAFHLSRRMLDVRPEAADGLGWLLVGAWVVLPLGFLAALLHAELSAKRCLEELMQRLATRPSAREWRDHLAAALDDPELQIAYRDRSCGRFRDHAGGELTPPPQGTRAWVAVERDGEPVAALVIDETLIDQPEVVRAATATTLLAVEHGRLEGELRASRARIFEAAIAERRRFERDLHDSAQQRLVALRIHLGVVGDDAARPEDRAQLEKLGLEVDEAIDELRSVARGLYPQRLLDDGVAAALKSAVRGGAIPVRVEDIELRRHPQAVELAIYFCCLEALQNVAKHAGAGASALVRLREGRMAVYFSVEDDGEGFDPASVRPGNGLTSLRDRLAAVGGTMRVESSPGQGTRITGRIPVS
jgi:signal transduction histidine kinase